MPLVRIDIIKRDDPSFIKKAGQIIYESMIGAISVPENDYFQVLNEHDKDHLIYDPNYLNIHRTDNLIYIQITLNQGRTTEQKKFLFQTIADKLNKELKVRKEDLFINLIEVNKENWSFGNGIAQYAN